MSNIEIHNIDELTLDERKAEVIWPRVLPWRVRKGLTVLAFCRRREDAEAVVKSAKEFQPYE
jgi:hypothetical protein